MENRNGLIIGLIRKLTDYGDYPQNISSEALASIFYESKHTTENLITDQCNNNFYDYAYNKICTDQDLLKDIFSESHTINFSSENNYNTIIYVTQKMGLILLFTGSYKGNQQPGILMSLFLRLLIEKVFESSFFQIDKNKYQPDSFNSKIAELFEEAQHLNYELAVCAIEPFWAKMTYYTNSIPLYYCSKENLSAVAINSEYTSPKSHQNEFYKAYPIDYIKNSAFYLPTFALEKDESLQPLVFNFRELLPEISKFDIHKQQKEIKALFQSATAEQQQSFAGNSMLIFKM
ncbi:hypothetical protein [Rhodoflexus sp.]